MKKMIALVLALCTVFALCACGGSSAPAASDKVSADLTVGTGGESGTYYLYTGMVSQVVGEKTDIKMTVVATGGSKDNLVSMDAGMYDLATVQSDVMTYAYNGSNSFAESGALPNFRVLCALYPETVQMVTTNPAIKSVDDMRGKKVLPSSHAVSTFPTLPVTISLFWQKTQPILQPAKKTAPEPDLPLMQGSSQ